MRLQVLSDLHLEFGEPGPPAADVDVIVLAGDIALGTGGIEWARTWAQGRAVIYIAGNHEFYGHSLPGLIDELQTAADGSGVSVLENDELVLGGVRFLGCTLWSDFDFAGRERRAESMALCARVVRDYHVIRDGAGRPITPAATRSLHLASREWLTGRLAQSFDGPTVVVTHHAPLALERPPSAVLSALAGAFSSDLTALISAEREALWIFGHTHRAADVTRHGARVLSNPRGYPNEPVDGFDPACCVTLTPTSGARASATVEDR